jgi:N4-gp56 family major capsid protein
MQTEILTGSLQSVKHWSSFLSKEVIARTYLRKFMGTSDKSIIQVHQDMKQGRGDNVKYDLRVQLTGYGVHGSARLKGNEQRIEYHQDSLGIDQIREGVNYDSMSQQRTLHDLRRDGLDLLADFFARVFDELLFAHLCGTVGGNTALNTAMGSFGGNTITAADAEHTFDVTGGPTAFSLDHIRKLREKALLMSPILQPVQDQGEGLFVLVLRPEQITSLKNESGGNKWREILSNARERGSNNPIFTGSLGMWDNVVLHESAYLPRTFVSGSTWNCNGVFLGAQAGHIAFGNPYSKLGRKAMSTKDFFSVFEDVDDYGDKTGVAAASIVGMKKARFNSEDFGVIRVYTQEVAA